MFALRHPSRCSWGAGTGDLISCQRLTYEQAILDVKFAFGLVAWDQLPASMRVPGHGGVVATEPSAHALTTVRAAVRDMYNCGKQLQPADAIPLKEVLPPPAGRSRVGGPAEEPGSSEARAGPSRTSETSQRVHASSLEMPETTATSQSQSGSSSSRSTPGLSFTATSSPTSTPPKTPEPPTFVDPPAHSLLEWTPWSDDSVHAGPVDEELQEVSRTPLTPPCTLASEVPLFVGPGRSPFEDALWDYGVVYAENVDEEWLADMERVRDGSELARHRDYSVLTGYVHITRFL